VRSLDFDSSQKFSTLFGQGGIDIDASSDLEPGRRCQFGDNDNIPVVVFDLLVLKGAERII